jgi:hypothetical protein
MEEKEELKSEDNDDVNYSSQSFVYLRAELYSQWPVTESARIRTTAI